MIYVLFYGGLAGALITLIIAIILFIKLDIVQVIRDLFGIRPQAKGTKARAKRKNRSQRAKQPRQSEAHLVSSPGSTSEHFNQTALTEGSEPTELLDENWDNRNGPLSQWDSRPGPASHNPSHPAETTLLGWDDGTGPMSQDETTLLGWDGESDPAFRQPFFKKELDIMVVHSDIKI